MVFTSFHYLVFFPMVAVTFFAIPKRYKNLLLLTASYYFYMSWVPQYAILIAFSTISTYYAGYLIEKSRNARFRRVALGVNIFINLAILFVFKYYDFFVQTIGDLAQTIGVTVAFPVSTLLLPVGISFYTFQSLGYSIDVYRRDLQHEESFVNYALFVSFFPQLVAGPIERAMNILPQFHRFAKFEYDRVVSGMRVILVGIFKKIAVADLVAPYVDIVYGDVSRFGGITFIVATILFSIQIYCDFSAYSDIAAGSARVLGYELMGNFNSPYFATSIGDFWSRWHISLSTWFRDYFYIPLGGNRRGWFRRHVNLFLTFVVSGLWHGANLTFIVWGALHGLYRIVELLLGKLRIDVFSLKEKRPVWLVLTRLALVNLLVLFAWIFFRAENVGDSIEVVRKVFTDFDPKRFGIESRDIVDKFLGVSEGTVRRFTFILYALLPLILFVFEALRNVRTKTFDSNAFISGLSLVKRWGIYIVGTLLIGFLYLFENGIFGQTGQFIYFQF
jgi:D-alanyl-lipoteichoic acid acyltransferase DltB (MBOAT superfamily)